MVIPQENHQLRSIGKSWLIIAYFNVRNQSFVMGPPGQLGGSILHDPVAIWRLVFCAPAECS
jgi:hypothetical protein